MVVKNIGVVANMPNHVSYENACKFIKAVASARQDAFSRAEVRVSLTEAVGRVASCNVTSPIDTPTFDSSAMDGYAVNSKHTLHASPTSPIILEVQGCVMAGDSVTEMHLTKSMGSFVPCVEIMTGAPFPAQFDACIPFEQVFSVETGPTSTGRVYVQVLHPALPNQHRRMAGSDYRKGDLIARRGSRIDSTHCLAAASVGIKTFAVLRKPRLAVLSTGTELQASRRDCSTNDACTIPDANSPYLASVLQGWGAEVLFVDSVPDDIDATVDCVTRMLQAESLDMIISTGAVSAGRLDLIPQVVAALGGGLHFHHVAMRPGHPVLFASLPAQYHSQRSECNGETFHMPADSLCAKKHHNQDVAFFGLPGNPIAAAAGLKFLVSRYIREILQMPNESHIPARIALNAPPSGKVMNTACPVVTNPRHLDQFRHGYLEIGQNTSVVLSGEQSPAKVKPFVEANCWVHIPRHITEVLEGDVVHTYAL